MNKLKRFDIINILCKHLRLSTNAFVNATMFRAFWQRDLLKQTCLFKSCMFLTIRRWWVTRFIRKSILCSIIAILITSISAISLQAQTGSLRLEGIVWDPSGNPLSGVAITAVEQSTGLHSESVSDSDGYYRFLSLQPGIYTLSAKTKEFKAVIHRDIYLFVPGSTLENISFELSAIDKEIGPGERTRLMDSDVAVSLTQKDIDSLPLLNRDPLSLLIYQPGVQINGGNEALSTINGLPTFMNAIRRDGISITDPLTPKINQSLLKPIPDSISSFQIITAGANAEYGGAGGAQFTITTRPGTKTWDGNLYDYVRNDAFDNNEFFNRMHGISKPKYKRNLFGGTLSGHVGKKALVFGSFEGNRTDQTIYRNRLVLTDDARKGIFKWYTPDDTTRTVDTVKSFNILNNDSKGIDSTVASTLKLLPLTNNDFIGDGLNTAGYQFNNDIYTHHDRADVRVDYDINSKHRLFFRFNLDRMDATDTMNNADPSFPGQKPGTYVTNDFGFIAGSTYTINPSMINELRIGYLRASTDLKRPDRTTGIMLSSSAWFDPLNTSSPKSYRYPSFDIVDNFSHARNVHAFKYGFTFRRSGIETTDYSGAYSTATSSNDHGNVPTVGPSVNAVISETDRDTFEKLYNSLLGRVESVSQTFQSSRTQMLPSGSARNRKFTTSNFSGFIQDSWKLRPSLTLNLGLRYEFRTVPKEANGYQVVLDKASKISNTASISDFQVVPGNNWYSTNLSNFAPRVGFAWDIFGNANTVLRGSYGMHFDPLIGGVTNFIDQNSYGLSQDITLYPNSSGTDDIRLSNLPAVTPPTLQPQQPGATRSTSIALLDQNLKTPQVHQFQVTLEHRLFGAIVEAGFTSIQGRNLFQYLNLNQTKTTGDFLASFQQLKSYIDGPMGGVAVTDADLASNTLVKIFGNANAVFNALSLSNFRSGQVGKAANIMDKDYYSLYKHGDVSIVPDNYIRNFPQFDKVLYGTNSAESWHNALRIGIRKTTANYGLRAFYTLSKSMDTESSDGSSVYASNSFNPGLNKAYSDFDRRHVLNISWDYKIPFGRDLDDDSDMPRWVNALLAGWNLGSLWVWESGQRFSVYSGLESQFAGVSTLANVDRSTSKKLGTIFNYQGTVYWFDPDAVALFSHPVAGQSGDSGRNSFKGPKYFNLDMVLHKRFTVRENQFLQLRLEGYNLFNKTRFALPDNNLSSSSFGTINSTQGNPRLFQFALKYQF
jgi:hypothetical protein